VGGISIFTFLVTPAIFGSFGRDAASSIVDKLFPFYFPYNLALSILALLFFLASGAGRQARQRIAVVLLFVAVTVNAFVTFKLYPAIKKTKQEIASFEKSSADSPGRRQFGRLHGISAVLNLLVLADGTVLVVLRSVLKK
jgi:amino acid permease